MKTQEIAARQRRSGQHPLDDGADAMVSSKSSWADDVWDLDVGPHHRPMEGRMRWEDTVDPEITENLKTLAWEGFV